LAQSGVATPQILPVECYLEGGSPPTRRFTSTGTTEYYFYGGSTPRRNPRSH